MVARGIGGANVKVALKEGQKCVRAIGGQLKRRRATKKNSSSGTASFAGTTYSVVIGQFDAGLGWVVDTGVGGMIQIVPSHWMPLPDGPNSN